MGATGFDYIHKIRREQKDLTGKVINMFPSWNNELRAVA